MNRKSVYTTQVKCSIFVNLITHYLNSPLETFKSLLDAFNNIDPYLKAIAGFIAALAAFSKLREGFALRKSKEELKLDLEILKELKANHIPSSEIEKKINFELERAYENRSENLVHFFTGIAVFIGFGLWSISIFQNYEESNPWIIMTLLCSLIGLSMVLVGSKKNENTKDKEVFYQIGFYNKSNFRAGVIMVLLTGILTPVLYLKSGGFSFWIFLTGLFFIITTLSTFKNIRRIRN